MDPSLTASWTGALTLVIKDMSVWMISGGMQNKAGTPWYIHTLKQPLSDVLRLDCMQASKGTTPVQTHRPLS